MSAKQYTREVKIDGIGFRFQRLKVRRATRAKRVAESVLTVPGMRLLCGAPANDATADNVDKLMAQGISADDVMWLLVTQSASTLGRWADPDAVEGLFEELLAFDAGQGVELTTDGKHWSPLRDMGSLDPFECADELTVEQLLREFLAWQYGPTIAATGIRLDTSRAATTHTPANGHSGGPKTPPTGAL